MRLWLFRLVTAIAIPALLLLTAEVGLRLLGIGYTSEFTVPCRVQGRKAFCDNDHFSWQFFPPGAFRLPPAFAIPAEKPQGTFRIFIVGESAAQGDPDPSYSLGRYLEVMLRERFPEIRFEVVNTGIAAVNSHVLLPAVRDLSKHDADMFVLYMGNNEVVGPYGAGTTLTRSGANLALIRAAIFINATRLGQLLGGGLRAITTTRAHQEWRGMEMFLKKQVPADSPALVRGYGYFSRNLRDIVSVVRSSGARVLVSTVAVNLKDSAPFASSHRTDLVPQKRQAWDDHVRKGLVLEKVGRYREALKKFLSAATIEDRYPELQYLIGRAYYALGEFAKARKRFVFAKELDTLRFRADQRINEIIRAAAGAAGPGVELVDAERLFARASLHGIPGRKLFYDHVHLTPQGNYLLAQALFPRIAAQLPEQVRHSASTVEPLSQSEADQLLALTAHDRSRLALTVMEWLSQPPFTARLNNDQEVQAWARIADVDEDPEITAATYRLALSRAPKDRWLYYNYGLFLETRDPAAAAAAFRQAVELLPNNYAAREKLAEALVRLGKFKDAIVQCDELLRRMPYHPPAYLTMAYAQAQLGSFDESIANYEHAVELRPIYALDAYTNIGIMQLQQGRFERAATSFKKAMALDAGQVHTAKLRSNLSYALKRMKGEAQRVLERKEDPSQQPKTGTATQGR